MNVIELRTPALVERALKPVSAAELYDRIRLFVARYVALSDAEGDAISLWVMVTHTVDAFNTVPYLSITSAEARCGKTLLLEVLELIVARPWLTGHTPPVTLALKLDLERPTLLLDESDTAFTGPREYSQALRGVLNTGYRRRGIWTTRYKGEPRDLSTFGPKAIGGIGTLPTTIADRSIPVRLTRKLMDSPVQRYVVHDAKPHADSIKLELEVWAECFLAGVHNKPAGLDRFNNHRASDVCEPLLQIAESCNAEIAKTALRSLLTLCGGESRSDQSPSITLLAAVRDLFFNAPGGRLSSDDLARGIAANEELPFGKFFDKYKLAALFRPHGIRPKTIRFGNRTAKGYDRSWFEDVWRRYLPQPSLSAQA
jgi:hypothetical protein